MIRNIPIAIEKFLEKHAFYLLSMLLVVSFFLKIIYVFNFTAYSEYVVVDMAGYWDRAVHSMVHGDHAKIQWNVWPPFAHITLAWFFRALTALGQFDHALVWTLVFNVFMSTLSALWVYLIGLKLYPFKTYAFVVALVYSFFFPLMYLNAFVLSEHLSLFMLLLSIVVLVYNTFRSLWLYFITGVILAFAIGMRPSFGIIGLVYFLYIFLDSTFIWSKIKYVGAFTLGYVLVLGLVILNNYSNSEGKLTSLSSNGGINFYMASCEYHKLLTYGKGGQWYVSPPSTLGIPELGITHENEPLENQKFFYTKGYECLKRNTTTFFERFKRFKYLYEDTMFPRYYSATYFADGMSLFSKITWGMTLLLLLLPFLLLDKGIKKSMIGVLVGIVVAQLIVLFFFNIEQRYLYGFFFAIELLSVLILFRLLSLLFYGTNIYRILIVIGVGMSIYGIDYFSHGKYINISKKNIEMTAYQDKNYLNTIKQKRNIIGTFKDKINTINFKTTTGLIHEDLGKFAFDSNIFIDFKVEMQILKSEKFSFLVVSDDGFILTVDNQKISAFYGARAVSVNRKKLKLSQGNHLYYLSYYQGGGPMAIRAYYEVEGKRFLIGEDSEYVIFR